MTKYKINIENNSNKGDIIINIPEDKDQYSSDYWIKKGNTCAKNLNWQGLLIVTKKQLVIIAVKTNYTTVIIKWLIYWIIV